MPPETRLAEDLGIGEMEADAMGIEGRSVICSAPAKVNLNLFVGQPDDSGYHPLDTVFQALSLREYVRAEVRASRGVDRAISVQTLVYRSQPGRSPRLSRAATDEFARMDPQGHLAVRAAEALGARRVLASNQRLVLTVHKTIPVAGGMAGGSADAAATLVAANHLLGLGLSHHDLLVTAAGLGADIPACLTGGNCRGTGRGDQIEPLTPGTEKPGPDSKWWVLVFQKQGLSTPEVFRRLDQMKAGRPDRNTLAGLSTTFRRATGSESPELLASLLSNDLQQAAVELRPELAEIGGALLDLGALGWMISGSGPTVAALASSEHHALQIAESINGAMPLFPGVKDVAVAWGPGQGTKLEGRLPSWVTTAKD